MIKEEHYTVCREPGGNYVCHFTPPTTKTKKHAEVVADNLVKFLKEKGSDKTLQAIGGNLTNVNTGWKSSCMHRVKVKLGHKLNWLVSALYTIELSLQHLIATLDGKTLSNNKWTGNLGKMLEHATELEIDQSFPKVSTGDYGDPLILLEEDVVNNFSTDQAFGCRMVQAIKSEELPSDLLLLQIGPVNHARWLTTANLSFPAQFKRKKF